MHRDEHATEDDPRVLSRRSFVGWMAVLVPAMRGIRVPEFVRRRADVDVPLTRALAAAVLPSELGADGIRRAADAFVAWTRAYRAGAELSHGYGSARIRTAGPDPSVRWALQLHALDDDARKAHGRDFASITTDEQRAIVRAQVTAERATSLNSITGAQHIAAALLAHFYASPEATDLCYEARVAPNTCRPLSASASRPVPLRRANGRGALPERDS